jgi:hypothetical protein
MRPAAALVIRGTPGAGKSALLEWAAATAGDRFQAVRAAGSAAEFGLPFATLHQIVRPVLSYSLRLPRHRREALDVAFGKESDSPPDLFSVAMAALDLFAEAAARKPVLVLADDVHWMDPSSQQALAFVGRRISADRVVLLATHRDGQEGPLADQVFASIDLAPLDRASAVEILDRVASGLDARTRTLIQVADGNPLALLELPRTVTTVGDAIDADRLPLTRRLERSFAARIGDLDATTRAALNLAALNDSGDLAEIIAATELVAGQGEADGCWPTASTVTSASMCPSAASRRRRRRSSPVGASATTSEVIRLTVAIVAARRSASASRSRR